MSKDHFLFYSQQIEGERVLLDKQEKHHVASVLRVAQGDEITVTNGFGSIYRCKVESINKDSLDCTVIDHSFISRGAPEITAAVGLPDRAAFEEILQALTALGVRKIVPLITEHCRKPWWDKWEKCRHRFDEKMVVAMKQCLYPYMPDLDCPVSLEYFIRNTSSELYLADPYGRSTRDVIIKADDTIVCLIGPPGGFSEKEQELMEQKGTVKVRLASNRLRTELAAVVFCSQVIGLLQ